MTFRLLIAIIVLLLLRTHASANPNQFGSSGLLTIPSADTLDSANFCFGVWGNCSDKTDTGLTSIMPVTLTLGIATFWEVYGTYPNVSLNNEAPYSGRGTSDIGTKLRFYGKRSSPIKIAVDFHVNRYVDDKQKFNGKYDVGGDLIASFRSDLLGAHLYGGYRSNGNSRELAEGIRSKREYPFGGGLEYFPSERSKVTLELTIADAVKATAPIEALIGFQYYITPHLTFNLASGMGINSTAADWRVILGLSTCQGVGAYIKPVPEVRRKGEKGPRAGELMRPSKVVPLTPLLIKTPELTTPASKFEVPIDSAGDEIIVRPYGTVIIPPPPALAKAAIPVIPVVPKLGLPEQPVPAVEEPVAALPVIIPESETPTEYALTRVSGVTPLYGIRLKGPKVVTQTVIAPQQPVVAYRKFRLPDNLFEFDNADMVPEVQQSVSELADFIRKDKKWVFLRIDGHTDGVGSLQYNMDLSLKRAISVANYLITHEGIDPARIFVRGMGKTAPIADNSTDEGRKLNRRFEIVFLVNKEAK